jgi:hypothetical protein
MSSTASLNKAFKAIAVTLDRDGHTIRAVVTLEALEALCNAPIADAQSMLQVYRDHQPAIEVEIIDRYSRDHKLPVVVHLDQ